MIIDMIFEENFKMINSQSTMITEWDLVCEDKWLKTFAKLLLFSGRHIMFIYSQVDILFLFTPRLKPHDTP